MDQFFKPLDHTVATAVDTRCNQKLLWNGYTYNYHITLRNNNGTSWRCLRSKKAYDGQYCHAIATTFNDGAVKQKDEHIHEPQYEQNEMAYMKSQFLTYLEMNPNSNIEKVITVAAGTLPVDKRVAGECLLRRVLSTYAYKDGKMKAGKKKDLAAAKRKCPNTTPNQPLKRARHDPPRKVEANPEEASNVRPVAVTPVVQKKNTVRPEVAAVPKPAAKANDTPLRLFGKASLWHLIRQVEPAQAMNDRHPLLKPGEFRPSSTVPKPSTPMGPPRLLVPIGLPRPAPGAMHSIPIIMPRASTSIRTIGSQPSNSASSPRTTVLSAPNRTTVVPKTEVSTTSPPPPTLTAERTAIPPSSARTSTTTVPPKVSLPSASRRNSRPMVVPKTEIITLSPEPPNLPASKTVEPFPTLKPTARSSAVTFVPRRWVSPLGPSNTSISTPPQMPTSRGEHIRTIIVSYIPN